MHILHRDKLILATQSDQNCNLGKLSSNLILTEDFIYYSKGHQLEFINIYQIGIYQHLPNYNLPTFTKLEFNNIYRIVI